MLYSEQIEQDKYEQIPDAQAEASICLFVWCFLSQVKQWVIRCRSPPGLFFIFEILRKMEDKPMAKPGRLPDFRKMYPEASKEVIELLKETERKMQYQEYDLKAERTIIDQEAQQIRIIPSREDSYERLVEQDVQFLDDREQVEDQVLRKMQYEMLHKALSLLSDGEEELIRLLFFEERTEREVAETMGIYHNAVHKQKKRILRKLKNILKKF